LTRRVSRIHHLRRTRKRRYEPARGRPGKSARRFPSTGPCHLIFMLFRALLKTRRRFPPLESRHPSADGKRRYDRASVSGTSGWISSGVFTFLVSAPAFDAEDLKGLRLGQITVAIEKLGFQVVRAAADRGRRGIAGCRPIAAIGCMVVELGQGRGSKAKTAALINLMRRRGLEMPIVMLVRRKRFRGHPGRGARLYRRLHLPCRGDAGVHRQETW